MKKRPDTSVKSVSGRSFINSMNEPCGVVLWFCGSVGKSFIAEFTLL
jgi:hypothetical protein